MNASAVPIVKRSSIILYGEQVESDRSLPSTAR
jgi:hypothetical protein